VLFSPFNLHIMRHYLFLFLIAASALSLPGCKSKVSNEDIANLPRQSYNRGGVSFSLAKVDGFKELAPDSVGWSGFMQQTEENGQVTYLFLKGHDIQLGSPQVRVEYIAKSLPNCKTAAEMHTWLKSVFINPERQGRLVESPGLTTLDGQEVEVLEIYTPNVSVSDTVNRSEKRMAWAYVEDGDRWVGFNFSAIDSAEYFRGLDLFRKVVRSFKNE
jgi:hypothetical protein